MTIAEKRKEISKLLISLYNALDPSGKNTEKFKNETKDLSDSQFIALFKSITTDPKKHLYFEIEAFENEPDYETIENAIYNIVGDEYCHLYDYVVMPHLSSDKDHPFVTKNKIMNGYINLRRVQQLVNNKNHIPVTNGKRDPRTSQVTQESKAARISDTEQFALICQGNKKILKEMFGPRGGDPHMRDEMEHQISTTGSASLDEMLDSKFNKTSLNTANVYFIGAGLETDLVTKNGILPRTVLEYDKKAKSMNRSNVK